jgi:uncharacterized protein (TIGR04255 family)
VFALPEVGPYHLARAPLAQALVQARFPLQARLGTLEGIAAVQDQLAASYPYLAQQQVQSIELQFSPEGPSAAAVSGTGANFTFSADDGHAIVLAPDSATLTTGAGYVGIKDFSERFAQILSVLGQTAHVPRCDRLGVRYLTVAATPPGDRRAWTRWFRPEVVGWVGADTIDDTTVVSSAITQVSVTARPAGDLAGLPADVQALVRHGLVPAGSSVPGIPPVQVVQESFLVDLDMFVIAAQAWDVNSLTRQFEALHGQIDRFFRWSLTEPGGEFFGLEE